MPRSLSTSKALNTRCSATYHLHLQDGHRKERGKKKGRNERVIQNKLQYSCEPKLQISPLRLLRPGSYLELSAGLHVRGESQQKTTQKRKRKESLQQKMPNQINHFISNFDLPTISRLHISTRPSILGDIAERRGKHAYLQLPTEPGRVRIPCKWSEPLC